MWFYELQFISRYIILVFVFGYLFFMVMIFLNMFFVILNDFYYEVKNVEVGDVFVDVELGVFMVDYIKEKISKFKDEIFEFIEGMIMGFVSFV